MLITVIFSCYVGSLESTAARSHASKLWDKPSKNSQGLELPRDGKLAKPYDVWGFLHTLLMVNVLVCN